MFEKLSLMKRAQRDDSRVLLKWKDYVVGDALEMNLRFRKLQEAFERGGPRGLLAEFFEPDDCDQIVLSLTKFT
jgi:hypothetical protein